MSKKNLLLTIQNGFWMLSSSHAETLGDLVATVLTKLTFSDGKEEKEKNPDKADEASLLEDKILLVAADRSSYLAKDLSMSNANGGSVAIISISGPMMKDDYCGDPGTKTYGRLINSAIANPNISAIILQIDSPGGTVAGTQDLANIVRLSAKPIVTLAEDLMASASYWVGMSADYVMANTGTTQIGSIGTMTSFADMQPYWEKMGIKFHNINASASTDKNEGYMQARQGNYAKYRDEILNPLNEQFMSSVKERRGDKLDIKTENVLSGKVYVAPDALKFGLIDAIGNLNDAIDKAFELADNSAQSQNQNNQNNMKKITILASQVMLLALCGASVAEGKPSVEVDLTDDLAVKLEEKLLAGQKANTDLATANEKITSLEASAKTAGEKISTLETSLVSKQTELDTLKASNPGSTNTTKSGNENTGDTEAKNDYTTEYDTKLKAVKDQVSDDYK